MPSEMLSRFKYNPWSTSEGGYAQTKLEIKTGPAVTHPKWYIKVPCRYILVF